MAASLNYDWLRDWSNDVFDGGELDICFTEHDSWLITLKFDKLSLLYGAGFAEFYPRVMLRNSEQDWIHGSISYDPKSQDIYPSSYYVEASQKNLDAAIGVLRKFVEDMQEKRRNYILDESKKLKDT